MQGLGEANQLGDLVMRARKMHKQRGMRNQNWDVRGGMDDWAADDLCREALRIIDNLIIDYPSLEEELTTIREKINEQLGHFS